MALRYARARMTECIPAGIEEVLIELTVLDKRAREMVLARHHGANLKLPDQMQASIHRVVVVRVSLQRGHQVWRGYEVELGRVLPAVDAEKVEHVSTHEVGDRQQGLVPVFRVYRGAIQPRDRSVLNGLLAHGACP